MRGLALALLLAFPACTDETISGYADPTAVYRLTEIGGEPFTARASISFPRQGLVTGEAPCNTWTASQSVPYPWLDLGPIAATRRACPDLEAETTFFDALGTMTLAVVENGVLTLSNEAGGEMVFRRDR